MLTIRRIDPIYCKIHPKEDLQLIKSCLEYESIRWKQGAYHSEKKSANAYFCNQKDGTFLAGLLPRVIEYCDENKIKYEIIGTPNKIKPMPAYLKGITLREEDQVELLLSVRKHMRGLVVAPPGIGKTVMAGAIMSQYCKESSAFVVHTSDLFKQSIEEFGKWFGEENVGIIGNSIFRPSHYNVIMVKTADVICQKDKKTKKFIDPRYRDFFDLLLGCDTLIIDEAHHLAHKDGMYKEICERCPAEIRIGFTATPNDKKDKKKEGLVCEGYLGPIIGRLTLNEGVKLGLLAPPKLKLINVPITENIAAYKTYKDLYKYGIVNNKARNRLIAKAAYDFISKGQSVLIMITDVVNGHGEQIADIAKSVYGIDLKLVQGKTEGEARNNVKRMIQNKETLGGISTIIWREGTNMPSLNAVINAGGGKSDTATVQTLGRVLRKSEGKEQGWIVDFLDNYRYLAQHTVSRLQTYVNEKIL